MSKFSSVGMRSHYDSVMLSDSFYFVSGAVLENDYMLLYYFTLQFHFSDCLISAGGRTNPTSPWMSCSCLGLTLLLKITA
jgi:hypothetical protein